MAKPSRSTGSGYGDRRAALSDGEIRAIVRTVREIDDTNPCQTLLEKVLGGLDEFRSIRDLLPSSKDLDKDQIAALVRIRGETARLPDPNPLNDTPKPSSTRSLGSAS